MAKLPPKELEVLKQTTVAQPSTVLDSEGKILTLRERLGMLNQRSPMLDYTTNGAKENQTSNDNQFRKEVADLLAKSKQDGLQNAISGEQQQLPSQGSSSKENQKAMPARMTLDCSDRNEDDMPKPEQMV